ncbi:MULTISPECIES: isochorismatase family protein [unclassified Streptomyces]|uniref:isochorismatase family protein n=1 Tax=unclassified Streptomyces TaxID=2593676 RepID=UPI000DC7C444|nr:MULTISPECIES: isochorismatase family protein [unclassified Streptomyces]AWZ09093.1 isochorismatase [Streptomyces sp. ICC4]AWZ16046.1 isochorismatase [Streptomyces sp. ICC1]
MIASVTSALILVDLMPRIIALPVAPHSGERVLDRCRLLAEAFRAAGRPVVAVRVERPGVSEQPPGSGFADGLVQPGDVVIVKRTVGAFHGTGLDDRLRGLGVDTLVLAGLVTTMGVESTARAASDHGYELEFVADAMSGFAADEHDFTVEKIFPRFGDVHDTAHYV